jgi:gamma-glutamylcyclotransferase (GGCT)/AIG2-like uncharacterized protein YtfP
MFQFVEEKMTYNFFAYGTLMCEDILSAVIGSCLAGAKGKLNGYRRKTIKGEIYPGIVASPGEVIEGRIYKNLSAVAWKRLDLFEGHRYRRDFVEVELSRGSAEPAQTYALKPEFVDRLSNEDWCFEEFLKYNKKNFEAKYIGFEILHQTEV